MTDFTSHHVGVAGNPVTRFFNRIWNGLVYLGENSTRGRALQKLNAVSDAELEARGVTRQEIVRRIFADRLYL